MATLKDIAKETGYTTTTVSAALRGLGCVKPQTAATIREAASRLGYRVNLSAKTLRSGRSGLVSLFVPNLDVPFYAHLARSLCEEARSYDFEILVQQPRIHPSRERDLTQYLSSTMADGFLFSYTNLDVAELLRACNPRPVVMFEDWTAQRLVDTVNTPSITGTEAAIRHLAQQGCTRIGVIGLDDKTLDASSQHRPLSASARAARQQAALDTLHHLGLPISNHPSQFVDWSFEGGIEAVRRMQECPFDGALCMSDLMAAGVLQACTARGIAIPDDLKVVGFDGTPESMRTNPPLSTIAVDFTGMARAALTLMEQRIAHPNDQVLPQTVTAGFTLEVRESSACR